MLTRETQQRFVVEQDFLALVLHDFERGFDPSSVGQIGSLHMALRPGLLVTGHHRPLHAADLFRERLDQGDEVRDVERGSIFCWVR